MAIFVVLVNELFSYVDLKSLPKISLDVFSISSNYSTTGLLTNAPIGDIVSSVTSSPIVYAAVSSPAVETLSLLS